ncbi:MAG: PEP-CTERM sorting domain-containing protein, partial [Microcystaceae cyanobacterium]
DLMLSQTFRYAGYDGRSNDIGTGVSPGFMPLISDNWNTVFFGDSAWNGIGTIPDATRAKMESIVAQVHGEGKILRFWNLPLDIPNVWEPLYDADVDLINTDDLAGLSEFIQAQQTVPEPGSVLGFLGLGLLGLASKLKQKVSSKQKTR